MKTADHPDAPEESKARHEVEDHQRERIPEHGPDHKPGLMAQRGRPASAVTGEPLSTHPVQMRSKPLQHMPSGFVCRLSIDLPDDIRAMHYDMIQTWLDGCVEVLARSSEVFRLERPSGSAP